MNVIIDKGNVSDIDELARLYDDLNDYLASGINYPGWKKGVYPIQEDAISGVENGELYVARQTGTGKIIGSIILNHKAEEAYHKVKWKLDTNDYSNILVVHTLVVHPLHLKNSIGKSLMEFAYKFAKNEKMKSIRLDVYEHNTPAIHLYESCGFLYVATVDLGLSCYGLDNFHLYEKLL